MDYHIYVHNVTESNGGKPTTPKPPEAPSPTKPKPPTTPKPTAGGKEAASGLSFAAAAIITAKLAEKAVVTYDSFASTASGDYRFRTQYANFKSMVSAATNPISTIVNEARRMHEIAIFNRKAELQRELLGDSMISERTKKV